MIIQRQFDQEMADLRDLVQATSQLVMRMYECCTERLRHFDATTLDEVRQMETEVNRNQMRIDDLSWKIMALYQPTASDLRSLIGAIKIASNLERMGDEIIVASRRGLDVATGLLKVEPNQLVELQVMTRSILKDGLSVLGTLDLELAESIFTSDDALDKEFAQLFEFVKTGIKKNPEHTDSLLDYLSIGRSLERIGDYATNLAEIAIFMKKGQDVRHHGLTF
jgi:phosphate transport system protein